MPPLLSARVSCGLAHIVPNYLYVCPSLSPRQVGTMVLYLCILDAYEGLMANVYTGAMVGWLSGQMDERGAGGQRGAG